MAAPSEHNEVVRSPKTPSTAFLLRGAVVLVVGWLASACAFAFPPPLNEGMIDRATHSALAAQHAVAISDALLGLDGGLDPALGLDAIQAASDARAAGACERAQRSEGALVVDGPCVLAGGRTVSGSLDVRITIEPTPEGADEVRVELELAAWFPDQAVAGHVSLRSRDGLEHDVVLDLSVGGHHVVADLTARAVDGTFVIDGSATSTRGGFLTVALDSLVWAPGACYPSAGRIAGGHASFFQVITLDALTTSRGRFQVVQDRLPIEGRSMPGYDDCPGPG